MIKRGDPITCAYGLHGALNARAGFLVEDAKELLADISDYVEKLVAPYFSAVVDWYETVGIGVTGGALWKVVHDRIGDPFFGVSLNPGHLIHLDEWPNSPVFSGSGIKLRSGMALQVDVIPATGTRYFTTNIEDGVALADEKLREEIAAKYPEAWSAHRGEARLHGRRARHPPETGSSALLEHSGVPAAVLAFAQHCDGHRTPLRRFIAFVPC